MKILVVTQYFWPENFRINQVVIDIVNRGHEVSVLTGKPNYPLGRFFEGYSFFNKRFELWNGVKIYRSPLMQRGKGGAVRLFLNYFSFAFFASVRILRIRDNFDCIFVYEPSPITVGIPAVIAKRKYGAKIFFWVQDLWPESISAAGGINNRFILSSFDKLTKYIYLNSDKILVQSKGFIPYIVNQGVSIEKLIYFPNPAEDFYKSIPAKSEYISKLPPGFKIIFAGNIGYGQSFETLMQACRLVRDKGLNIKWVIIGDGRMRNWVENRIIELEIFNHFILLGSYPSTEMPDFFACADALIVSLKKNPVFSLTIPAKLQSYFACGRPIIGSLDGEGAKIIEESGAGFTSPAEDSEKLALIVERIYLSNSEERKIMGDKARQYYEHEFDSKVLLDKLLNIFNN